MIVVRQEKRVLHKQNPFFYIGVRSVESSKIPEQGSGSGDRSAAGSLRPEGD